jgi:biopolymer transport protein ExbD
MSHGSGGGGSSAVPNLTPLLDVVLQLLMFFMMCVNFVSEQTSKNINLPPSQTARPMDKSEASAVLFLNMNKAGALEVPGMDTPLENQGDIRFYLKQQFADDERAEKGKAEKRSIVIRADQGSDYEKVYDLLSICKEVGFKKLQLRAIQKNAN